LAYNFEQKTKKFYEKKQARLLYLTPIIALILGSMTDVIFPVLKINFVPPVACLIILIWAWGLVCAITRYGLMTLTPSVAAENILATMTDSLILVGMDGRITKVNRATLNILGYTAKELVNKEVSSIVTAKATDGNALLRQVLEQGRIGSRSATYLAKNGEKVPVLFSASAVKDRAEEPVGVVITGYDMREYKKMMLNLRRSEEKYRTLVDHALVGIAIHQDSRFIFANERFADMLGYTLAEIAGLTIVERVHPDERDLIMTRARRRQAGENEPDTYEVRLLKKDGSVLYALVSNAVVDYNGKPATLITVADTTDTKTRIELEQVNKELEAFSYSVSHDLRAPLRSIAGFSRILLEDYGDSLDNKARDYLRRVCAATQHMGELIDDLLKLSRVTRVEIRYEWVDLSVMAHSIAAALKETAPGRAVEFIIAREVSVAGDRSLLRVVLENLLGNAWKFTSKHPRARIEFGITEQDGRTVYFVRDDGAGFDMAYANKLFTPFQRLHGSNEFDGTGIGLATVQRIIYRHGGSVWAEGEVERGATFYFTLKS